jgi:hypothetical protein
MNPIAHDDHVPVWRSHINPSGLDALVVPAMRCRKIARAGENIRQDADAVAREVMDDQYGSGQIGRQPGGEPSHCLDSTSGEPKHYYIMTGHEALSPER